MAGLLEKDIRLIMQRKQMLLLFVVIAVVLGFSQDGTFILGYLSFCAAIVMVSTISYDELDHGYEFLMTLFHSFEYSTVNAEIKGKVESILKPKSGTIKNNKSRLHQQIDFGRK